MNVIRGDYRNSLSSIALALNSEDSETAHYAASVLQDVLSDFRSPRYRKNMSGVRWRMRNRQKTVSRLVEYMRPIIVQKVLTDMEQHAMIARMDEVLEKAWTLDRRKDQQCAFMKEYQPVSSGYSGL